MGFPECLWDGLNCPGGANSIVFTLLRDFMLFGKYCWWLVLCSRGMCWSYTCKAADPVVFTEREVACVASSARGLCLGMPVSGRRQERLRDRFGVQQHDGEVALLCCIR